MKVKKLGYCGMHYQRWRKYGDPLHIEPNRGNRTVRVVPTIRTCRHCKHVGPAEEDFVPFKNTCKKCNREKLAQWRRDNPERYAKAREQFEPKAEFRRAARRLGLDPDEMWKRWQAHDGKCEICDRAPADNERRLHMDHDHVTGAFRGFICNNCNGGIGRFLDDPRLLLAAAHYLELRST